MDIIEQLYYGNIPLAERVSDTDSSLYKTEGKALDLEKELRGQLQGEDLEKFIKYVKLSLDVSTESEGCGFMQGFRLGALMMIDLFTNSDEIMPI